MYIFYLRDYIYNLLSQLEGLKTLLLFYFGIADRIILEMYVDDVDIKFR